MAIREWTRDMVALIEGILVTNDDERYKDRIFYTDPWKAKGGNTPFVIINPPTDVFDENGVDLNRSCIIEIWSSYQEDEKIAAYEDAERVVAYISESPPPASNYIDNYPIQISSMSTEEVDTPQNRFNIQLLVTSERSL